MKCITIFDATLSPNLPQTGWLTRAGTVAGQAELDRITNFLKSKTMLLER